LVYGVFSILLSYDKHAFLT